MEMSAKKRIQKTDEINPNIKMFKDVVSGKTGVPTAKEFKKECECLYAYALVSGVVEEEIELLINMLCKCNLSEQSAKALLKCVIPQEVVSGKVIDRLMPWLLSSDNYHNNKVTSLVLQWIGGLLDNDLVNVDAVDSYYPFFFSMLVNWHTSLVPYAFKIIYKLTKPEDVSCQYIRILSRLTANKKCATALLWLFKTYKPHLILEDIHCVNANSLVKKIPCQFAPGLHFSQKRKQAPLSLSMCQMLNNNFNLNNNKDSQLKQCHTSKLIPVPTFRFGEAESVHMISLQETSKRIKFIIPDKIMSLMANEGGFHILSMSSAEVQNRFSTFLFDTLQRVFIRNESDLSIEEQSTFLGQLLNLEEYMQQGIPVVTKFLVNYLNIWDGSHHYYYLYQLIKWASFSSFSEFSDAVRAVLSWPVRQSRNVKCLNGLAVLGSHMRSPVRSGRYYHHHWTKELYLILRPLHMLFVSSDVDMKCEIISSLMGLIRNMFIVDLYRASRGWCFLFLKVQPLWLNDPLTTLQSTIRFVENLIQLGLCIEPSSNCLLHQAVSFYEMMSYLEETCDLPLWTVIPAGVVFRSFFCVSPVTLNKICRLLLRYANVTIPKLESCGQYENFFDKVKTVDCCAYDLINCMCLGKVIEDREQGMIFNTMPTGSIQKLTQVANVNKVFNLEHHMAFSMHNFMCRIVREDRMPKTMEECLDTVEEYTKGIADLITAYKNKKKS